jgi:hypothetical protein
MDTGNITQPTTTGSAGISSNGYWLDGFWYPYQSSPNIAWYVHTPPEPIEPTQCIGRAHVFECDHAKACKCGAVKRSNPVKLDKEK